jgi:sulfatase modifying factor 1
VKRAFHLALCITFGLCVLLAGGMAAAQSAAGWPALERSPGVPSARDGADDAAVIVAIEDYDTLPDVPGARSNGLAWYRYLRDSVHVRSERISVLTDHDAQEYKILDQASERAAQVGASGRLWFVFIGHGAPSQADTREDGQDGLLVGASAEATQAGIEHRSVRRSALLHALAGARGDVLVALDACFSGQSGPGRALVTGLMPLTVVDRRVPAQVMLFTAAQAEEFAGELPGAHRPAFSYLLLGALRGWGDADGDGKVTSREALDYTQEALLSVLNGTRRQHPTLDGHNGVLALGSEAGPNLAGVDLFAAAGAAPREAPDGFRGRASPDMRDADKADMIALPNATFRMGTVSMEAARAAERPAHIVTVHGFYIDEREVTVAEYQRCVEAGRCGQPSSGPGFNWRNPARSAEPINGVAWGDAADYCAWRGQRLPTESEWEYAARGERARSYAWGEGAPSAFRANTSVDALKTGTVPPCSTPGGNTPEGVCDLTGNVWEWVSDWYGPYPSGYHADPRGAGQGEERVIRGASYRDVAAESVRASTRKGVPPDRRSPEIGFRCARGQ